MRLRNLFAAMMVVGVWAMSPVMARASVLYDSVGFIEGKQSFVDSFDITAPGTLTVTLSNIAWLDTIADLNAFVTTSGGMIGTSMGAGTESFQVGPGMIYAHWFGDANGTYGIGVFGMKIMFQPNATPVGLPGSLILLLSGLGVLFGWQRRQGSPALSGDDEALTV